MTRDITPPTMSAFEFFARESEEEASAREQAYIDAKRRDEDRLKAIRAAIAKETNTEDDDA